MKETLRRDLHRSVLARLDARKTGLSFSEDIDRWRGRAEEHLRAEMSGLGLDGPERDSLRVEILDEIFAFGPITPLLADPSVSEVMVNGHESIYVERDGRIAPHAGSFLSEESLRATIDRMVSKVNRRLDESSPYVDARLPDGSRINAIIPPVSLTGACLTVRKFRKEAFSLEELVRIGSLTADASEYLKEAVRDRHNIIVSGGTGSGKTTLLNALSQFIPPEERIVTIEDAAEIRLQKPHVVRLEARPANIEGSGAVTIRDLVRNALRMRPDRIIVGECRGGEALDMLQAMNTGHDGSITTGHANTPRDMIRRLETMVLLSGVEIPVRAIREQIASAIEIIVHTGRLGGGKRAVTSITEITGMNDSAILLQELFRWTKGEEDGGSPGRLASTGVPSRFRIGGVSRWD
ncbi:MAG: CpaF family protein [Deltaproteobacteria bacterium]